MALSFCTRMAGDTLVIDWSMAGGAGCRPATKVERECLGRIAELEAAVRVMHGSVPGGTVCDPQAVADELRSIAVGAGVIIEG